NTANDGHPVIPEKSDKRKGSPHMERDHECEPERLRLALRGDQVVPVEQGREDHCMSKARDREQLANALKDSEHSRLKEGDLALSRDVADARSGDQVDVGQVVKARDQHRRSLSAQARQVRDTFDPWPGTTMDLLSRWQCRSSSVSSGPSNKREP